MIPEKWETSEVGSIIAPAYNFEAQVGRTKVKPTGFPELEDGVGSRDQVRDSPQDRVRR